MVQCIDVVKTRACVGPTFRLPDIISSLFYSFLSLSLSLPPFDSGWFENCQSILQSMMDVRISHPESHPSASSPFLFPRTRTLCSTLNVG